MKKNKYLLLPVFIIILLSGANFVLALEVPLPGLCPSSGPCNPTLPQYVVYFFTFGISIAGILALISFTIGAIGLINPNVESHNDAKDRMKGAVLGLVLTLVSFIIIRTINPVLTTPTLTPLPALPGVFYTNGSERRTIGFSENDVAHRGQELIDGGYNSIIYDCTGTGTGGTGPALLIWEYPQPNFQGSDNNYSGINVARKTCGQTESIGGLGSFRMAFETPGVYFCLGGCNGDMCSGYMSDANTSSQDDVGSPFKGNIQGVRIVGDYYGVIFHSVIGLKYGGYCNNPIMNPTDGAQCLNVSNPAYTSAADIFTLNEESGASGDGVTFYSEPHGWDVGQEAGFLNVSDSNISFPHTSDGRSNEVYSDEMCFGYKNVNRPDVYKYRCTESKCVGGNFNCTDYLGCEGYGQCTEAGFCAGPNSWSCEDNSACYGQCVGGVCTGPNGEKFCSDNACETFQDCPGSIRIKGHYLVGLYSNSGEGENEGSLYCQTFLKDVANLKAEPFLASGAASENFNKVYIFPIK